MQWKYQYGGQQDVTWIGSRLFQGRNGPIEILKWEFEKSI